jgi:aryl-alcohol dehydrogenase (NADP+)
MEMFSDHPMFRRTKVMELRMDYRNLGRSGLKVSPICLGTMMFGGPTDEALSARIIAKAREAGVNFIDTADVYNEGRSEEITGRAIGSHRSHWVLATKVANPTGHSPNERGLSRRRIMEAAEASLRRLGTDWIDIYYLHREDHATPLAETVRAMGDLVRQGKIRYFGVSNHRAWRVAEICRLCDDLGIDRPVVSQPYYNAMNRMPEVEHLPACGYYGLGVVPYSPLARGVLTGKYSPDAPPPETSRAGRQDSRMMQTEWRRESLQIAQDIKRHAEARGITAGQFAVGWVLNNRFVTAVIAGPRTEDQWDDYARALDYQFTAEDEALVDSLVVTGHPSTPGYNDPSYPIEGRAPRTSSSDQSIV